MKRVFILFAMIAYASLALSAETSAILKDLKGKVEVKALGQDWKPAADGMKIDFLTTVSTGFDSTATLMIGKNMVHIDPLTRLTVDKIVEKAGSLSTSLHLRVGNVSAEVKAPAGVTQDFKVTSPYSTASVRGTKFSYNGLKLVVREGRVAFIPGKPAREIMLPASAKKGAAASGSGAAGEAAPAGGSGGEAAAAAGGEAVPAGGTGGEAAAAGGTGGEAAAAVGGEAAAGTGGEAALTGAAGEGATSGEAAAAGTAGEVSGAGAGPALPSSELSQLLSTELGSGFSVLTTTGDVDAGVAAAIQAAIPAVSAPSAPAPTFTAVFVPAGASLVLDVSSLASAAPGAAPVVTAVATGWSSSPAAASSGNGIAAPGAAPGTTPPVAPVVTPTKKTGTLTITWTEGK
jgi:hypothetical protein